MMLPRCLLQPHDARRGIDQGPKQKTIKPKNLKHGSVRLWYACIGFLGVGASTAQKKLHQNKIAACIMLESVPGGWHGGPMSENHSELHFKWDKISELVALRVVWTTPLLLQCLVAML